MAAEPKPTFGMSLRELVTQYLGIAGGYGMPAPLASFGLAPKETEEAFSAFDQDYHISRFLLFSCAEGVRYAIDGEAATHVTIDSGIWAVL